MHRQTDRLAAIDWDVLIVLDALRYDYAPFDAERVRSPGNNTPKWIGEIKHRLTAEPTACITANPEVTRHTDADAWATRDDLWRRKWEYVNGIGTVPPEAVVEAVQAETVAGPDRRIYAHFAQPHGPYPKHDPPVPVMRNNPEAGAVQTEAVPVDEIIMDPTALLNDADSWLDVDTLRSAYGANVRWVWNAIQPLLGGDRTVVVTADHGELLGEGVPLADGREVRYGHPGGAAAYHLRTVPLAVFN